MIYRLEILGVFYLFCFYFLSFTQFKEAGKLVYGTIKFQGIESQYSSLVNPRQDFFVTPRSSFEVVYYVLHSSHLAKNDVSWLDIHFDITN